MEAANFANEGGAKATELLKAAENGISLLTDKTIADN